MKTSIYLIAGCLLMSSLTFAGTEPIGKGNGSILLDYQTTKFKDVFDNDGELKPVPEIRFSAIRLNARYGIKDNLNASLNFPFYSNAQNSESNDLGVNSSKSFSGMGDASVGLNYSLKKENNIYPVISIYQNLPFGKNNANGLNTGFGDFANSIYFDLFYEYKTHFVFNGNIGYQNRKRNYKNDFLGNVYVNYIQKGKYQILLFMKGKLPFSEVSNSENIVNYGLFKNSEGYFRYGAMIDVYFRKNMSLVINYENYLKGQFIGNGAIYSGGIKIDLNKSSSDESSSD
jgi:hypothetical protein